MSAAVPRLQSVFKAFSGSKGKTESETKPANPPNGNEYTGYKPIAALDYPYDEDLMEKGAAKKGVDPMMLRDKEKTSKSIILSIILFAFIFVAVIVWQALIAQCRVSLLCETNDASSSESSDYLFKTLTFRVPSALVWAGLSAGSLALLIVFVFVFFLLRKTVGRAKVVEIASVMRRGAGTLLSQQFMIIFLPILIIFVFLGTAVNWETAGSFAFGTMLSSMASQIPASIIIRGTTRTSAAAQFGFAEALGVAFRTSYIVSVAVLAISVAGVSAIYLIFSDIRALIGMIAGASVVALHIRMSTAIFNRAARDTIGILQESDDKELVEDGLCRPNIAAGVGSCIGRAASVGADLFTSVVTAVIVTAIFGSSLPFFYRDQFALCVFNHLAIDKVCGPFGHPEELSYATYICSNGNMYLEYPVLRTWGSNTAFVAAPFVLAVIGLLATIPCAIYVKKERIEVVQPASLHQVTEVVKRSRRKLVLNIFMGYLLIIGGSAALCFGLFGSNSEFQKSDGFGNGQLLNRMELDGSNAQCVSKFLNNEESSQLNPVPIPQGGTLKLDHYRPVTVSGMSLGTAQSTPWRLFLCILIGIMLATLVMGASSKAFVVEYKGFTKRLLNKVRVSAGIGIVQSIGSGFLYVVTPTILIVVAIIGSYKLYGPYGTSLAALGFLCPVAFAHASTTLGYVAESANNLAWDAGLSRDIKTNTGILSILGALQGASSAEFSNGASFLSTAICILAIVQQSGILPSPRDLIGSPEFPPTRFIRRLHVVSLADTYVLISIFIGTTVPILVAGLIILGANSATKAVRMETLRERARQNQRPDYIGFFSKTTRSAVLEALLPMSISLLTPLAVGFGLGSESLIAFLVALSSTGYIFGTFLTSTRSYWASLSQHMSARLLVHPPDDGEDGRISSEVVDFWDSAGPSLQILTRLSTSFSLVTVTLMRKDTSKGWIGAAILGIAVLLISFLFALKRLRLSRLATKMEAEGSGQPRAPPKRVSPFYEEGPTIDVDTVRPGSQMHDALTAIGSPTMPVSPKLLPGLSDRDETDVANRGDFMSPRATIPVSPVVFRDIIRNGEKGSE